VGLVGAWELYRGWPLEGWVAGGASPAARVQAARLLAHVSQRCVEISRRCQGEMWEIQGYPRHLFGLSHKISWLLARGSPSRTWWATDTVTPRRLRAWPQAGRPAPGGAASRACCTRCAHWASRPRWAQGGRHAAGRGGARAG
jgi:hypothetical protein